MTTIIFLDNKLQRIGYALLVFTLWNLIPPQRILLLQPNFPRQVRLPLDSMTNEKLYHAGLFMFFKTHVDVEKSTMVIWLNAQKQVSTQACCLHVYNGMNISSLLSIVIGWFLHVRVFHVNINHFVRNLMFTCLLTRLKYQVKVSALRYMNR